jgi:hypothetical protein
MIVPLYVRRKPGESWFRDEAEYHSGMRQAIRFAAAGIGAVLTGSIFAALSESNLKLAAAAVMIASGVFWLLFSAAQAYVGYRWRKESNPRPT